MAVAMMLARSAAANLIVDPTFTLVTYSGTPPLTTLYGQFGTGSGSTLTVAGWTTSGYNFVFAPGTADIGTTAGANSGEPQEAPGQYNNGSGYGTTYMWGSHNGGSVTLPSTDPVGGNFIAADGAYEVGAISQTVNGLVAGKVYKLAFAWAGAQQQSYTGTTTENWQVTIGSQVFSTGTLTNASGGFTGWKQAIIQFTGTSSSETISFLANGTPNGQPPFVLLGGLDLQLVPEVSNWMIFAGFGAGCALVEILRRRRRHGELASME